MASSPYRYRYRYEWTPRAARRTLGQAYNPNDPTCSRNPYLAWRLRPAHIIAHHVGGSDKPLNLTPKPADRPVIMRSLDDYGYARDGASVEYNFVIFGDGEIWEGFGPDVPGAHCLGIDPLTGVKASLSTYGVLIYGNLQVQQPTNDQVQAMRYLRALLEARRLLVPHDVPVIKGHRDYAATQCPASYYNHLTEANAPWVVAEEGDREEDGMLTTWVLHNQDGSESPHRLYGPAYTSRSGEVAAGILKWADPDQYNWYHSHGFPERSLQFVDLKGIDLFGEVPTGFARENFASVTP